jgi:zinc protease
MHSTRLLVALGLVLMAGTQVPDARSAAFEPTGSILDPFLSGVEKTVLPNGLTLLVRPQPRTGVVAINTFVKAGYFNEPDEVAGMAHLFEHMFFKGSERFPGAEQIAREVSRVGGRSNAGTIYDSTSYYFVLPKEGFERGMEIQADAIMHPLFDPEELDKESEVVIEESNRKLDNPPAVSMERMFATAFQKHRMRRWRIGSNEVLRHIDRDDLLAFFNTLYRPENMIVAVAGDVTPEQALKTARATFGQIPKGTLKKESGPAEPPQDAFRYGESTADIQQGYSVLGWHVPALGSDDDLALYVLSTILGTGKSSRLYRAAVGPDAASTVTADSWQTDEVGIFVVQASFDEEHRETVDRRLVQEIERIKTRGVTPYELQLAKNVIESQTVMGLQDVLGQASDLAWFEARFGYREMGVRLAEIGRLTPQDIQEAARRYLTTENLTLYHYGPEDATPMTREAALAFVRGVEAEGLAPEPARPVPARPAPLPGATSTGSPIETRLASGLTVVVQERTGAPVISAGVYFRGGRTGETSGNAGITQLMSDMMRRGTTSRSAEEINREIEFLGTQVGVTQPSDYFGFELTIVSSNFGAGLNLLADVVLNPTFPEEELPKARSLQLAAIKRSRDSSFLRPFQLLYETYFGNHPYALPVSGFPLSVDALTREDLVAWWKAWVRANQAVVVIVGDISAREAQKLAEEHFGGLQPSDATPKALPAPQPPENRLRAVEFRERKQSAIAVAYPGVPRADEDLPKLVLLESVTSGLAGTFFAELRGNRSLAYTVFAQEASRGEAGVFVGYMATAAEKEGEALAALIGEFKRLDEDGITQDDVDRAKAYFAGSKRIGRQTDAAHLEELSRGWMLGRGLDSIDRLLDEVQAVSLEELKATAARYLDGDNYTTAILSGRGE